MARLGNPVAHLSGTPIPQSSHSFITPPRAEAQPELFTFVRRLECAAPFTTEGPKSSSLPHRALHQACVLSSTERWSPSYFRFCSNALPVCLCGGVEAGLDTLVSGVPRADYKQKGVQEMWQSVAGEGRSE